MPGAFRSFVSRYFGRDRLDSVRDDESPICSELFSVERLEQHAQSLAASQPVHLGKAAGRSLVSRLRDNERVLFGAYRTIAATAVEGRPMAPAAEWLLDNFHFTIASCRS